METISKLVEIIIYVAIGIIFCWIGYKATEKMFKKPSKNVQETNEYKEMPLIWKKCCKKTRKGSVVNADLSHRLLSSYVEAGSGWSI